jgi:hypothetical protein
MSRNADGRQRLVKRVDELAALYALTDKLYRGRTLGDVYDAALDAGESRPRARGGRARNGSDWRWRRRPAAW